MIRGRSEPLVHEHSLTGRGVELVGLEPCAQVGVQRLLVVGKYFEGEFAAPTVTGERLCGGNQGAADAPTTPFRVHRKVMDVEQRPGCEGREALEAVHQSDRVCPDKGEESEVIRPLCQPFCKMLAGFFVQRVTATHGVTRVEVEELDKRQCMSRIPGVQRMDVGFGVDLHY